MVGLGSVLLGGCASFPWSSPKGEDHAAGPAAAPGGLSITDPGYWSSPAKADADGKIECLKTNVAASDRPRSDQPTDKKMEGQFALARLCEQRGETDVAEQAYREMLKKWPKDARLHHRLGVMELQRGNFQQAEERLAAARSLAEPDAELLSDIGYCYYLQQKLPEAEKTLREALKINPSYEAAVNNLALVLGSEGRYQEAKELFLRVNKEAETYANMGYVFAQNGEMGKAKEMYVKALTLDNTMKIAAKAALQIDEREKAQQEFSESTCRQEKPSRSDGKAWDGDNLSGGKHSQGSRSSEAVLASAKSKAAAEDSQWIVSIETKERPAATRISDAEVVSPTGKEGLRAEAEEEEGAIQPVHAVGFEDDRGS
jgi:Flp pilus assembly protein TadD